MSSDQSKLTYREALNANPCERCGQPHDPEYDCQQREYCTHKFDGYPGAWVPAEVHDAVLKELWACFEAAGADTSPLTCYRQPWAHLQRGEAQRAVEDLRRGYIDAGGG